MNWGIDTRTGLTARLASRAYYSRAIVLLHKKLSLSPHVSLHAVRQEGYSFAQAFFSRQRLAQALSQALVSGAYRFAPATLGQITADKRRTVYRFALTDRIVHGAVALMLCDDLNKTLPDYIHSYAKGRSRAQAVAAWKAYVRNHRRAHKDPKERGLYVLRCDIKAYGESIPVLPSSPLWEQLYGLMNNAYGREASAEEKALLAALIRPDIEHPEGGVYQPLYGIPDGAPVSALLLNLYVRPLDEMLAGVAGGFYARFGDDILFAHTDMNVFNTTVAQVDGTLATLSLTRNQAKTKTLFYNAAGRGASGFRGTSHIEFLGCKLGFNGEIALKSAKMQALLRDLSARANSTAKALRGHDSEERGRMVCAVLNRALDPAEPHAHPYGAMLLHMVDDRAQLKQFDYLVARIVLAAMRGDASVKGFRKIPYRKMRQAWKLRSVAYARNRR